MTRVATTTQGERILLQGFRHGGGINLPYVYVGVLGNNDNLKAEFTLGLGQANQLSEFFRQEAEFAKGEQEEMA